MTEEENKNPFDELIELVLDLDPSKYATVWQDIEIRKMKEVLTAGHGKFPKKAIPYIELMRKFLFANGQLIAMAAMAHRSAQARKEEDEKLIKPATAKDLAKL